MRQLTFVKPHVLEWRDVSEPTLQGPGEALVRPIAVARCDLDLPILRGDTLFRGPFPFGHEFTAEVVATSPDVDSVAAGDAVIVTFQVSCGTCPRCRDALSNSCKSVELAAAYGLGRPSREWGGAFQDLVRVPYAAQMLVPIPVGADPVQLASASDNMTDAYRTVGPYLRENAQRNVLVIGGAGHSIALYAVAMARGLGAPEIDYIDTDPGRLTLAEKLGANVLEGSENEQERFLKTRRAHYNITVNAGASAKNLEQALRATAPGGVCTSPAILFDNQVTIPFLDMYNTGVDLRLGRTSAREFLPAVLELIQTGRFDPAFVTTRIASWSEARDALFEESTKLIVRYDSASA